MKISFIGAGNMATAIIKSIVSSNRVKPSDIFVYDKLEEKADKLANDSGVVKCSALSDATNSGDCILLAVKPQDYESVLSEIKGCTTSLESKTFISIAAAISCKYVCEVLGTSLPVVRVMPNTPLLLGCGATAISRNDLVSDKLYSKICTLFASSGSVTSLSEDMMNKVICVNGSSPVYLYMLANAMIEKAIDLGLTEKSAKELVFQTLKGSVEMLMKSGMEPSTLIDMVASPGGTTLEAIKSLNQNDFNNTIYKAMDACTERAEELSR